MHEPVACLQYDSCEALEKRDEILKGSRAPQHLRVLLVTHGTSGVALEIPWADMSFFSGHGSLVKPERLQGHVCTNKHKFNNKILGHITRDSHLIK